jgi:NRPS condensation-like uncharacterized protein
LRLLGKIVPAGEGVLDFDENPQSVESKDSFQDFAGKSPTRKSQKTRAYHVKGIPLPPFDIRIITGTIPISALKIITKESKVSITEYLVSVFLYTLQKIQKSEQPFRKLPIKIQVPVNLRQYHDTKTLRNFSAFVTPGIDPAHGEYSFEEILKSVHHFLRFEATEKHLRAQVAVNLRSARNPFVRILPLFIKNQLIHLGYKYIGPVSFTSTISNYGVVTIPDEMANYIETFDFILGATLDTNISCGVLGYAENLRINFSSVIKESHIEREFFTFLVKKGIPVLIESNKE